MRRALALAVALARWSLAFALPVLGQAGAPGPAAGVLLRIGGEVPRPLTLTAEALGSLPRATVSRRGRSTT